MTNSTREKIGFGFILDKLVWVFFCATCLRLALNYPYVMLVDRVNVFAAIMCAVSLLGAVLVIRRRGLNGSLTEVIISLLLTGLVLAGALLVDASADAHYRAFMLVAAGLGGFWCARILLSTVLRQQVFGWLCSGALLAQLILAFLGVYEKGQAHVFMFSNPHHLIETMLLLSFGPLFLISTRKLPLILTGGLLLVAEYLAILVCGTTGQVIVGALVPILAIILYILIGLPSLGKSRGLFAILMVITAASTYFAAYFWQDRPDTLDFQAFRMESYPYSWHVAKKHPLFGIGLREPRAQFLEDYTIWHPDLSAQTFSEELKEVVTPHNSFLTFMTGAGIPFTAIYCFALIALVFRLIRAVWRPPTGTAFHPWVLWMPVIACLFYSLANDTLLLVNATWYFHLLLGLIPTPAPAQEKSYAQLKTVLQKAVVATAASVVGAFLGTHPALSPARLAQVDYSALHLDRIPVVGAFLREKAGIVSQEKIAAKPPSAEPITRTLIPGQDPSVPCKLKVNIRDYVGKRVQWAVMVILDNAETPGSVANPICLDRRTASHLVAGIAASLPESASIALRVFASDVSIRWQGQELPLRASRPTWGWRPVRSFPVNEALSHTDWTGQNNLCKAIWRSVGHDFEGAKERAPRIAVVTGSGHGRCNWEQVMRALQQKKQGAPVVVDVVAIGLKEGESTKLNEMVEASRGILLQIEQPEDVDPAVKRYAELLHAPVISEIEMAGPKGTQRFLPGAEVTIPPGRYTLRLPEIDGLDPSMRSVQNVEIEAGGSVLLDVAVAQGRPVVKPSPL